MKTERTKKREGNQIRKKILLLIFRNLEKKNWFEYDEF